MRKYLSTPLSLQAKGFTLIELLVVIAIIGILSSIVLANLGVARNKGRDAAVKSELAGMRASAELEYSNLKNSYNATGVAVDSLTCSTLTTPNTIFQNLNIQKAIDDIHSKSGNELSCHINAAGTAYAISAQMIAVPGHWCVDSLGHSTTTSTGAALINGATVCP